MWRWDVNYEQHQRMAEWDQYYFPPERVSVHTGESEQGPECWGVLRVESVWQQLHTTCASAVFNQVKLQSVTKRHGIMLECWNLKGKYIVGEFYWKHSISLSTVRPLPKSECWYNGWEQPLFPLPFPWQIEKLCSTFVCNNYKLPPGSNLMNDLLLTFKYSTVGDENTSSCYWKNT